MNYFLKNISLLFLLVFSFNINAQRDGQKEFENVLDHYLNTGEREKYKASVFLLKNMIPHKSVYIEWIDSKGKKFPFSEFEYDDFTLAYKDIFKQSKKLKLKPKQKIIRDVNALTAAYLIENIDLAFKNWKENSWSKEYSFDVFCNTILPYRNLIEPLEHWRKDYESLAREIINLGGNVTETDPVKICEMLVNGLDNFTFVNKRIDPSPILSPQQMLFRKQGSCPDLANFSVYLCRALGVAVTFDFTPHYGASSNRHFWNTVINKDGSHIPFNSNAVNGSENASPYIYNVNKKRLGKVFRKTYSIQNNSLTSKLPIEEIPNCFLREHTIKDVTKEYVAVSTIAIDQEQFRSEKIGYVNVFNRGAWKIIGYGERNDDKMIFENLGRDIVYLPSVFSNKKTVFLRYPYLIDKRGNVKELKPDDNKTTVILNRSNERKSNYIDFNTLEINIGDAYTLSYWDNGWNRIGTAIATDKGLLFNNVPSNALFQLLPKNPDRFERIFTIETETNTIFWY